MYICASAYVYLCVCMCAWLSYSSPFLPGKQLDRGQGVMGEPRTQVGRHRLPKTPGVPGESRASSSLISKSVAVRNGNEFSRVPFLWNSLCTPWELNKYLMMVLNLGSQQLFPALTLRAPWNRSGGEQPRGSSVFVPDPPVTPGPAAAIVHFTHPALGRPVLPPQLLSGSFPLVI